MACSGVCVQVWVGVGLALVEARSDSYLNFGFDSDSDFDFYFDSDSDFYFYFDSLKLLEVGRFKHDVGPTALESLKRIRERVQVAEDRRTQFSDDAEHREEIHSQVTRQPL